MATRHRISLIPLGLADGEAAFNPILPATAEVVRAETDLAEPGAAGLSFTRIYRSNWGLESGGSSRAMGRAWTHNHDTRITLGDQTVTILAAETLVKRKELVRDILLGMLLPEVLLVLVAASVIWFGVRSGLRPLDTLRAELADRSQADLRPVTVDVPEEIQPVVTEVNGLLMRLDTALTSQRHFVSDAAHQLRTPIAALLAQVEAAQHEAGKQPHAVAIERLKRELGEGVESIDLLFSL